MNMLCLHVDYVEWAATKEIKPIAEVPGEALKEGRVENCEFCMIAVENKDEEDKEIVMRAADAIMGVLEQVKVGKVVIYPYAHLSDSLSKASFAKETLNALQEELSNRGVTVSRAVFGWYKEFGFHCKGHPLSEFSRRL